MKLVIPKGATSRIITVFIQDSASTTGAGKGSLDQTSGITGGYVREGGTGVALAADENVTTEGTYQAPSTAAHVRIGTPANMPAGFYELHFHNDLWASGAEAVTVGLAGTGIAPVTLEVQLSDPVRGLGSPTALPNAAADAAGGLIVSDAGGLDADAQRADVAAILVDTGTTLQAEVDGLQATLGVAGAGLTALATAAALTALDGKIGTPAGASIAADLAQIESQTDDIGAAGAGLTALGDTRLANLDAAVSSRASAASLAALAADLVTVLQAVDTEVAAILVDTDVTIPGLIAALDTLIDAVKAKTDLIPAAPAAVSDIPTAVQNADALLGRNIAGGSSAGRTVTSALRRLRNRVAIAAGTMTTYAEDDATPDHTAAVTTAAGNPITEVDPA